MSFYCPPSVVAAPDVQRFWEPFMHEALQLAHRAEQNGDVPVGAVLVSAENRIVGHGHNRVIRSNDPSAHAEIVALRTASEMMGNYRLPGAVLVVTLEPCLMCLGAIIQARLAGVVFAATDPKAGCLISRMNGSTLPWSNHHFWILQGVLEDECSSMLSGFFQRRRLEKKISKNLTER